MGKFIITKRINEEYQFILKAENGQIILTSAGYSVKSGAGSGIESVKKHSPGDSNYDKKASTNGKFYFNLKASNSQVIGTSGVYESESGTSTGIESVKKNVFAEPLMTRLHSNN